MAVVNLDGTNFMDDLTNASLSAPKVKSRLITGKVRASVETVEVGSSDSANSTYLMARLPSNAVILPHSKLLTDDLASSGAPTMDIGVFNQSGDSGITDDDDALNDGIDVATATDTSVIKDFKDAGKELWEFVASQSEDPQTKLDVKLTLKDAAVNTGGTVTLVILYTVE